MAVRTGSRTRRIYLDSSAYLRILLGEPGGAVFADEIRGQEILTSTVLLLEARRTLVRAARTGVLDLDQLPLALARVTHDERSFRTRDLQPDLCGEQPFPLARTPRSLDLVHLRTALWFHAQAPLDRFVTADGQQELAAKEMGLPVLS